MPGINFTKISKSLDRPVAGFTIVELLVVIVVIAILATITVVAYTGIQARAAEVVLQSDLRNAAIELSIHQLDEGSFPDLGGSGGTLPRSDGTTFEYSLLSGGSGYCLTASSSRSGTSSYFVSSTSSLAQGACEGHDGSGGDVGGGGTNTYGDVRSLTASSAGSTDYTTARYYTPSGDNPTTNPTNPSTSTSGSGQYGYLYNWCAAMGGQNTAACGNATNPPLDSTITICPAGWRLPTGNTSGEYAGLNSAINSGSTSSDSGLRSNWFAQRAGYLSYDGSGFDETGQAGDYWTSTQSSASFAYEFNFYSNNVTLGAAYPKSNGFSVRCVAN